MPSNRPTGSGTRFDFKGSDVSEQVDWLSRYMLTMNLINQVQDILNAKLTKRGVDIKCLDISDRIEKVSGNKIKRPCTVKTGVEVELAKKIVKFIKDSKMKVQGSIQGDTVRVSGNKRDDLQTAIQLIRQHITDFPLQFENFRD